MARYMVRVELVGIKEDHPSYARLHAEMTQRGFARTLFSAQTGKHYKLPHAEYAADTALTVAKVIEIAQAAADAASNSSRILVTEGQTSWQGLDFA